MAATSGLLHIMPYSQLFTIYAVGIVVVGVFLYLVLIGKVPRRKAASKAQPAAGAEQGDAAAQDLPGYTFGETLKKGASIDFFLIAMFLGSLVRLGHNLVRERLLHLVRHGRHHGSRHAQPYRSPRRSSSSPRASS